MQLPGDRTDIGPGRKDGELPPVRGEAPAGRPAERPSQELTMKYSEHTPVMHAVLDGEATPGETRELERLLATDSTARAEFEDLKRLFEGLKAMPKEYPPEGLVASVMANIPLNQHHP